MRQEVTPCCGRRGLLTGLAATAALLAARPVGAAGFRSMAGCTIAPSDFAGVRFNMPEKEEPPAAFDPKSSPIIGSSGRGPAFDRALGRVLLRTSRVFEVTPGFGFFDDSAGMNALASRYTRIAGTWGTVVFGLDMLGHQLGKRDGDITVAAICAHEFGHIFQYRYGDYERLQSRLPGYCTELHADFLAGYFLRLLREERQSIGVQGVGRAWEQLGSSDFNRPGTHGTSKQRIAAIEEGYFFAENGEDIDGAAAAAWDHVRAYG
jgi:hypothetical protein